MADPNQPSDSPAISPTTSQAGIRSNIIYYPVRLPLFWPKHPEVWFMLIETKFRMANSRLQQAHYNRLLASLPNEVALEVYGTLASPLSPAPYDALRAAIVERTGLSERIRLRKLLFLEQLRD